MEVQVPKRERYVVQFEVVTQFGDVEHRGTIDFASYDEENLEFAIRGALGLIGQPGSCCKQYTLRAHATKLWKFGPKGERTPIPIPHPIVEQQAGPLSHREALQRMSDFICVCEDPSKCTVQ